MEPEVLMPYSQGPATGPYPEPDESSPHPQPVYLYISPSMPRSSVRSFPFTFSDIHFPSPRSSQWIRPIPRPCVTFCNKMDFYGEELLAPRPIPNLEIGWLRLLIPYIRSYPPWLEAVSSIRNPRTRHTMATGTHKITPVNSLSIIPQVKFEVSEMFKSRPSTLPWKPQISQWSAFSELHSDL
jgi:hypothetical protein